MPAINSDEENQFRKQLIEVPKIKHPLQALYLLLFCGGYIYNYLILDAFGINISKYFTIIDYIGASLDVIVFAIIISLIATLSDYVIAHFFKRNANEKEPTKDKAFEIYKHCCYFCDKIKKRDFHIYKILLLFTLFYLFSLSFLSFLLWDFSISRVICPVSTFLFFFLFLVVTIKFKEPEKINTIIFFTLIFLLSAVFYAENKSLNMLHTDFDSLDLYYVNIQTEHFHKKEKLALITGCNDFFFFTDDKYTVLTIPKSAILYMEKISPK